MMSVIQHAHTGTLPLRARDENRYTLARQENMLRRIRKLTCEWDKACHNVAIQADELSHLRQEVCMNDASIIELRRKLAFQDRRVLGPRTDDTSTVLD
jgi:hypothetical protein